MGNSRQGQLKTGIGCLVLIFGIVGLLDAQELNQLSFKQVALEARAAGKANDIDRVFLCSNRLIKLAPEDSLGYFCRGTAYRIIEDFNQALQDFNKGLQISPQEAQAYAARAKVYGACGNYEKAAQECTEALRLDYRMEDAFEIQAHIKVAQVKYEQALEICNDGIKIVSLNSSLYAMRALIYLKLNKTEEALADANRAVECNSRNPKGYFVRAKVQCVRQHPKEALEDVTKALEVDPRDIEAIDAVAWLLAVMPVDGFRDGKRAVELATTAAERLHWKRTSLLETLAAAEAEAGLFDDAVRHQQELVDWMSVTILDPARVKRSRSRLTLYQNHQPFRDRNEEGEL